MSHWREWVVRESSPEATAAREARYASMRTEEERERYGYHRTYFLHFQPVLVLLFVSHDEEALKGWIRGDGPLPSSVQRVVVQGADEARRIQEQIVAAKNRKGRSFRGSTSIALEWRQAQEWGLA